MPRKTYTERQLRLRALAAQRILDDKIFKSVVEDIEDLVEGRWRRTMATEVSEREGYWCLIRGLDLVLKQLRNVASKGTVSDDSDADTGGG